MSDVMQLPASDAAISAMVAEKVAGLKAVSLGDDLLTKERKIEVEWKPGCYEFRPIPDYLHDANTLLPLLNKHSWKAINDGFSKPGERGVAVEICGNGVNQLSTTGAIEETFCRAACLALLRAHGVTVLEAKR